MIDKDARIRREITIWLEDSGGNPTTPRPPAAPIGPLGPRQLAQRIRERGMFPGATRTFGLSQLAADDSEQGWADHSCACDLDCISSIEQPRFRGTSGPAGCDVRCGAPWEGILDRLSLACFFISNTRLRPRCAPRHDFVVEPVQRCGPAARPSALCVYRVRTQRDLNVRDSVTW
jgi:hypothetical protein